MTPQEDTHSLGFRITRLENSHENLQSDMKELAVEMKQFSADTRSILLKLSDVVASNSRIEERLHYQQTEQNRVIDDIRRLVNQVNEHANRCDKTTEKTDRLEASINSIGKRFEETRDEHKEIKYKVTTWSAAIGLIVSLVIGFMFKVMTTPVAAPVTGG